jgi:hypothetical protein
MKRFLIRMSAALALGWLGTLPAMAADDGMDGDLPAKMTGRSERLDIYGAGMCHQCEWRPHAKVMAAADQCGAGADGKANLALFECGRNPACDSVCNFVRCEAQ